MERLTKYDNIGGMKVGDLLHGVDQLAAYDRLAQYEDTGLTPEQVVRLTELLEKAVKDTGNNYLCNICKHKNNEPVCMKCHLGDIELYRWCHADEVEEVLKLKNVGGGGCNK